MKQPAVYIMSNGRNGTLYIGVTSDLRKRVWQHREHVAPGFTATHQLTRLVWFELHGDMHAAITQEKRIKAWKRAWKVRLIETNNPYWNDLWASIIG